MERYHAILQDCCVPAAFVLLLVNVSFSQDTNRSVSGDKAPPFQATSSTTTVVSSNCSVPMDQSATACITLSATPSALVPATIVLQQSIKRSSPNSSSATFWASVTPSVKISRRSPGSICSVAEVYCAFANMPIGKPSEFNLSIVLGERMRIGEGWPALT